jgi:hypothetical protein
MAVSRPRSRELWIARHPSICLSRAKIYFIYFHVYIHFPRTRHSGHISEWNDRLGILNESTPFVRMVVLLVGVCGSGMMGAHNAPNRFRQAAGSRWGQVENL